MPRKKPDEKGEVTMSYEKILLSLDGSSLAERAIPYAKAIATRKKGCEVVVFSVGTSTVRFDRPLDVYLDSVAKELTAAGIKASTATAYGGAAEQIVEYADNKKMDLIVMSTHGYSGIKRWVMGSVAQKVLSATCVPILLVKSKAPPVPRVELRKILLPLDGSTFSEIALSHVEAIAEGSKAEIILVRVTEPPIIEVPVEAAMFQTAADFRDKLVRGTHQQAGEYLEKVKASLGKKGIKATAQVLQGKAAQKIMEVAQGENADMIVMGTHGRSGVSRWAHGSVASRVVEDSVQPVLLIRPCPPVGA